MGRVISFSEFECYFKGIKKSDEDFTGVILDTNILISLTYELKVDYKDVVGFYYDNLKNKEFVIYTTVNTRFEFLDFYRRLIMTENLRNMIAPNSKMKIPQKARTQIQSQLEQLTRSEKQGGDLVFSDRQIKKIKSSFSAGSHSGQTGWLKLCDIVLKNELNKVEEDLLSEFDIKYITPNDPDSSSLFPRSVDWSGAKSIAEHTCMGLSDSMILNSFSCSNFPFIVSSDFDMGYAALSSQEMKDVVMPDRRAKRYREFHFE